MDEGPRQLKRLSDVPPEAWGYVVFILSSFSLFFIAPSAALDDSYFTNLRPLGVLAILLVLFSIVVFRAKGKYVHPIDDSFFKTNALGFVLAVGVGYAGIALFSVPIIGLVNSYHVPTHVDLTVTGTAIKKWRAPRGTEIVIIRDEESGKSRKMFVMGPFFDSVTIGDRLSFSFTIGRLGLPFQPGHAFLVGQILEYRAQVLRDRKMWSHQFDQPSNQLGIVDPRQR